MLKQVPRTEIVGQYYCDVCGVLCGWVADSFTCGYCHLDLCKTCFEKAYGDDGPGHCPWCTDGIRSLVKAISDEELRHKRMTNELAERLAELRGRLRLEMPADQYPTGKVCAEPGCRKPVKIVPTEHGGTRA